MKVAHFNYSTDGGAAIAARRLHDSLVDRGLESTFYFRSGIAFNEAYVPYVSKSGSGYISWISRSIKLGVQSIRRNYYLQGRPDWLELFSFPTSINKDSINFAGSDPDIVHLHWLGEDFVDYPSFFSSIPDSMPIVWTLHDMNPFTGGCHYAWHCDYFRNECGNCFQLAHASARDASRTNLLVKHNCLKNKNIHIAADSYWLEQQARASRILSGAVSVRTIHYGLDTEKFSPKRKDLCREIIGIDPEATVVGFGAYEIKNKRKGLGGLMKALTLLKGRNITLLTFGGHHGLTTGTIKNVQLGLIDSPEILSAVYSAIDIFVIPSLYEAFGQTSLEAMSCGTPVVGFDTGGIPDMVSPGRTGLLARPEDVHDLAEKIQWMIDHPHERKQMGINARQLVEQEFTLEKQAEQYATLYKRILKS